MFPIVGRFKDEAILIIIKLNSSLKDAFEGTADVVLKLDNMPQNPELAKWLIYRHRIYQPYFSKGDPSDVNEVRKYFIVVLNFEKANGEPISKIMNAKEFWYYHKKIHAAIGDIDSLNTLVKNTKSYCKKISDKFESTAQDLKKYYQPLFNRKLK